MAENSPITFVCCVESGSLEVQTVRMIESLRRWGGKFADAPIFAVNPRFGPPLAKKTSQLFERFGVEYIRYQPKRRYSWYPLINKPLALVAAEEHSTSEFISWLDSDILIVGEPEKLIPYETEDFLCCATDKNIGITGVNDPQYPFWREICQIVGVDIESIPWIKTEYEGENIRLYWNSGVFVYRRSLNFAKNYLQVCLDILDTYVTNHSSGIFFHEQMSLGLAMVKMGLSWRSLPCSHNYGMGNNIPKDAYNEEQRRAAKIIHYHDAMWPSYWATFVECLSESHPPVADWLTSLGPLKKNETPLQWYATRKLLHSIRSRQKLAYIKSCRVI